MKRFQVNSFSKDKSLCAKSFLTFSVWGELRTPGHKTIDTEYNSVYFYLADRLCNIFVFQSLYQNILNIYEDTLLILVSKDLYKLQILKVKLRESKHFCFSGLKSKKFTVFHLSFPFRHTYIFFKYLVAEFFSQKVYNIPQMKSLPFIWITETYC